MDNNIVEKYIADFRNLALYEGNEKRTRRFKLLCEIQSMFPNCDFDTIRDIIEGLSRQVHGMDYTYDHIKITGIISFSDMPS